MKSPEQLLIRLINFFAEKFKDRIVLTGGMLLRLYQSPRATQDVDFIFISSESKKTLHPKLCRTIGAMKGVQLDRVDVNSRGIFMDVSADDEKAALEITVRPRIGLRSEPISTAMLSQKFLLSGRIVSTLALPEAFAHKIAATLERESTRDLYDLSQMEAWGAFDIKILRERLARLSINRKKPIAINCAQAADLLAIRMRSLTHKKIEQELYPLLPTAYRTGVLIIIKASVGRIIQRLRV